MSLSIYIPRMLGTVNRITVHNAFNNMGIGRVTDLDMIYKINENQNAYYFAFITISLYDTPQSSSLLKKLNDQKKTQLVYDEEAGQYWEIKKYIPRNERNKENTSTHVNNSIIADNWTPFTSNNIWSPYSTDIWNTDYLFDFTETKNKTCVTAFTAEDKLNLVQEYEILEKEIHQHFLASI
jgi:hypothetical protein